MNKTFSHSYPGFDEASVNSAVLALQAGDFSGRHMKVEAEKKLAHFMGVNYAKITGSGFAALQAALVAAGVQQGEKVIIPTITCPSVYHSIASLGATPVVVDVNSDVPLISLEKAKHIRSKDGARSVVIIPQMFGLSNDVKLYQSEGFFVIEDIAQCFMPITSHAQLTVMSFSPTKLFTVGYGGAVAFKNQNFLKRIAAFLDPDHAEYEDSEGLPFRIHSPISDFQAAMLISQLDRYQRIIEYRNKLVEKYDEQLSFPVRLKPVVPFRYQIVLNNGSAKQVAKKLRENGVGAWALGSHLLHKSFGIEGSFDNADWWSERVLSLPLHENLSLDDIASISVLVRRYI